MVGGLGGFIGVVVMAGVARDGVAGRRRRLLWESWVGSLPSTAVVAGVDPLPVLAGLMVSIPGFSYT